MPSAIAGSTSAVLKGAWRPTKIMNMQDLSRDDDFLSHLLVEKLGTGGFPLVVHKMDPSRRLPKTDPEDLMKIVRRLVAFKGPSQTAIRQAVDDLLSLTAVRYYLRSSNQKQVNAFATHASRYFELYLPSGSIEIAHTSRYSHRTGKSELCILATRPLAPGTVISELKGSMADLTEEEDKELKGTDIGHAEGVGIRRDFSVIHSKQLKKNHLFLGPARFVNHDCDHNVELFREGRYITFRVIKHIGVGEEVTAHYGDGYFGRNNRHCLCQTCEINQRGGYAPHDDEEVSDSGSAPDESSSDNDEESNFPADLDDLLTQSASVNVNERRTRRGVYAVLPNEAETSDADVEPELEPDATSELASALRSSPSAPDLAGPSKRTGILTPETDTLPGESSAASTPRKTTPSFISTRSRKARAVSEMDSFCASISTDKGKDKARATSSRSASAVRQLETPPLTSDNGSTADGPTLRSSSRLRARGDAISVASRLTTPMQDRRGKAPASARTSTADVGDLKGKGKEDPELEGRSLRRRPIVPSLADAPDALAKKPQDGPRGVDGKLLPTCMTCKNVLPVISVDDKVVWNGLPEKTGKRGRPRKQIEQECPRCMRHLAIYATRWPERVPTDGTPAFVPTPRENRNNTPAYLSHKTLAAVNHKLSDAASSSRATSIVDRRPVKRQRTEEVEEQGPSPKRHKVTTSTAASATTSTGRPRGRPPKNKVGMSTKARELLGVSGRRSSRTRVPTLKLRESEPPSKGKASPIASSSKAPLSTASTSSSSSSSSANSDSSDSSLSAPHSEANDRHHLRSSGSTLPPEPCTPVSTKTEVAPKLPTPKSLAVASQPREANGRFGKKATTNGRYMRKNFHPTAGSRRIQRGRRSNKARPKAAVAGPSGDSEDRAGEEVSKMEIVAMSAIHAQLQSPKHSLQRSDDEMEEDDRHKRRKVTDEDAELQVQIKVEGEEADLSVTSCEEEVEEEEDPQPFRRPLLTAPKSGVGLLSRPNPLTFARRKWTSSVPPEDPEEIPILADIYCQSSTDDETDLPITPEDDVEHPAVVEDKADDVDSEESGLGTEDVEESDSYREPVFVRPKLMVKAAYAGSRSLTFKPNPLNMSRRRWGPASSTGADPDDREELSEGKPSSKPEMVSFTDLFEADADEASIEAGDSELIHGSVDPDISSEEEGFRGPSILSIYKPGRRSSSASSALLDLTDDSEQIVERLVSVSDPPSNTESRPPSATSLPQYTPPSPRKSPSKSWQQTVLLPVNAPFLHHSTTVTVTTNIAPASTQLIHAGWESGSSDDTD
ncbi:transcription factor [Ganoderma sinense ZZ0214-1]|uniref:Transcription factor n=1 Tax=Ganoderma sinense ZZ0214-1 TaxID=1077348 RepID=A0A2G8SKH7_9APHY|nr:transcription factor [Ganoderma sinense ZZ0214-1]